MPANSTRYSPSILGALCEQVELLPGAPGGCSSISMPAAPGLRHAKRAPRTRHTKIAGKQVLAQGPVPAGQHDQHRHRRPLITGMRLRADGPAGKGHTRMIAQTIGVARRRRYQADPGAAAIRPVRQPRGRGGLPAPRGQFSLAAPCKSQRSSGPSPPSARTPDPGGLPRAVRDPDTAGRSRMPKSPRSATRLHRRPEETTARLMVRRVKDANHLTRCSPVWRYHLLLTNPELPTAECSTSNSTANTPSSKPFSPTHRRALIHAPPALRRQLAWILCAAIAHNLLRAAGAFRLWRPRRSSSGATRARKSSTSPLAGLTSTTPDPAPAQPLALVRSLARTCGATSLAQPRHRPRHLTPPAKLKSRTHRRSYRPKQLPLPITC